jgi:hypothetical protein
MDKINRVFLSYSWSTPDHERWVVDLAERLVANGVDVELDKWFLKEGNDKYVFMEEMVKSADIDKVLIILDKTYKEKADSREGGVGTETQIISPQIYKNAKQDKFIPVVAEKDEKGNSYIPTFLEGKMYIDLSSSGSEYEENYDKLLRNIYGKSSYSKPQLGKAPSYLFEDRILHIKTNSILRSFDHQIDKYPERVNSITMDFLDEFFNSLKDYTIDFKTTDITEVGKEICDNLEKYRPLRNDFVVFFEKLLKSELDFNIEILIKFIERLPLYESSMDGRSIRYTQELDNFRFIIHELFLYMIASGLKMEKYKVVEELLYTSYFFQNGYNYERNPKSFIILYHYIDIIDSYYKQAFSKNFHSPMAALIMERVYEGYSDRIVEADLLCHYIASMKGDEWFPLTYLYQRKSPSLFDRLVSRRYFEKVKTLFDVDSVGELQEKLNTIKNKDNNKSGSRLGGYQAMIPPIYSIINVDMIGTSR